MKIDKKYIRSMIREILLAETGSPGGLPFSWPQRRIEGPESEEIRMDRDQVEQRLQDILDSWSPESDEGQKYQNDIEILLNDIRSSSNE